MTETRKTPTPDRVWKEYQKGLSFNDSIRLDETVQANENFFIGE